MNGKRGQHARTDRQCKQRDGNSKNKKEMLMMEIAVTKMKNDFDGLISGLDVMKKDSPS